MKYRRALMLLDAGQDALPVLATLRRLAPRLERLVIVSRLPESSFAWLSGESTRELEAGPPAALELLKAQSAGAALHVEVRVVPSLGGRALAELCVAEDADLLVVGMRSLRTTAALNQVRRHRRIAILFVEGPVRSGPVRHLRCYGPGRLGRLSIRTFLRDHADDTLQVTLLAPPERAPRELAAILEVAGVRAKVADARAGEASLRQVLEASGPGDPVDLLVVARIPAPLLLGVQWPSPVLLLPPLSTDRRPLQRPLDAADVIDDRGLLHLRLDLLAAVGDLPSVPDQAVAIVAAGRVVATETPRRGALDLPAALAGSTLGLYRVGEEAPDDPLTAIETRVTVIRPGARPLILFDSELSGELLGALSGLSGPPAPELLAIRLRPVRSCRSIREQLRALGLEPRVLDARGVLDEGDALDVAETNDPVRLARVARHLRQAGFPVTTIVHRGATQPEVHGFTSLAEPELLEGVAPLPSTSAQEGAPPASSAHGALIAGNRIELELDNATARRWLIEGIRTSSESIHLQVYMVLDDDVGAPVEAALAEAGARGVQVRVLVDSLHGFHGSFGTSNPLLERLSTRPGVELRVSQPIRELPSLAELKQRDHRKLVVLDGRVALVGGRNLSHEYYAAFDEVALAPDTGWREVPWLDAGARVEGPAVSTLAASFLEAWTGAGGERFPLPTPATVGTSSVRVIVHHGLRDARTLEAYLELVDGATSHVYAVNGFPLVLELQHALLRALRRGVRVRVLSGHVTPTHDGTPFPGPWATARTAATELVHSRLDPLVAEGGEAFLFAVRDVPGWAPGLGIVHPHVHAKVMSVDGKRCAVGSANLDITASYWESELMLLVEDPALVSTYEARIEALLDGSVRMQPSDATWREQSQRRAWMRHWPGVLSV